MIFSEEVLESLISFSQSANYAKLCGSFTGYKLADDDNILPEGTVNIVIVENGNFLVCHSCQEATTGKYRVQGETFRFRIPEHVPDEERLKHIEEVMKFVDDGL